MQSRITELEPLRKLTITWNGSGDVTFELEPKESVLLTVIHRRLPDRSTMLKVSAGWHMHLDVLVARASGEEPALFWDGWSRLQKEYDGRLPADAASRRHNKHRNKQEISYEDLCRFGKGVGKLRASRCS